MRRGARSASRRAVTLGLPVIALATAAATLSAYGGAHEPPAGEPTQSRSATDDGTAVVAGTKQLPRASHGVLLWMTRVGRLTARCSADGAPSVVFTAARLLPTAAVTVASPRRTVMRRIVQPGQRVVVPPAGPSDLQTWQVEPFAKAGVHVTTISVAMGRSPGTPAYACGFSAHAATTIEPAQPR